MRALNSLVGGGLTAEMALDAFPARTGGTLPAGTILFGADQATKVKLATAGRNNGLLFRRLLTADLPPRPTRSTASRGSLALTGAVNQDVWSLRNLAFPVDFMTTAAINSAPTDPLVNYDVIWNTGNWPGAAQPTARARLTAFFAAGGGYLGSGPGGANFLTAGLQTTGLTVGRSAANGRERHHPLGERGFGQPDHRRISGRGHGDRRSAELVLRGARVLLGGRTAAADGLLPLGHVAPRAGRQRLPDRRSSSTA